MTPIHYTAKVLPDGHLPLPKECCAKVGEEVEVTVSPTNGEAARSGPDPRSANFLRNWVGAGEGTGEPVAERHDDYLYGGR